MLIDHSYIFFCKAPIQIFYPFKNYVGCSKSSSYTLDISLLLGMFSKYFPSVCGLPFPSLHGVIQRTGILLCFIFNIYNFILLSKDSCY